MSNVIDLKKVLFMRLEKKKKEQTVKKKLSYEEVIRKYEELSAK